MSESKALSIFNFESHEVRAITDEHGEPWFVLTDILSNMGSTTRPSDAVSSVKQGLGDWVVGDYLIPDSLGRARETIIISEPAATYLLARSNTDDGRRLNRWIHTEVLPSIRKTGSYIVAATPGETALAMAQSVVEMERKQAEQQRLLDEHTQKLKQFDSDTGYLTASAYCKKQGVRAPLRFARDLGKLASKISKELEITIGSVPDERYGSVNSYAVDVLDEAMEELVVADRIEEEIQLK